MSALHLSATAAAALCCLSALPSPEAALTTDELAVRIVCHEALRAPRTERRAIFGVALDRAVRPGWWGQDLRGVLLAEGQFASPWSKWCGQELPPRDDGLPWSPGMVDLHRRLMDEIAADVRAMRAGETPIPLPGATYFHARRLGRPWSRRLDELPTPSAWLHRFYAERNDS